MREAEKERLRRQQEQVRLQQAQEFAKHEAKKKQYLQALDDQQARERQNLTQKQREAELALGRRQDVEYKEMLKTWASQKQLMLSLHKGEEESLRKQQALTRHNAETQWNEYDTSLLSTMRVRVIFSSLSDVHNIVERTEHLAVRARALPADSVSEKQNMC